ALVLGRIEPPARGVVLALRKALNNPTPDVRRAAAVSLCRLGSHDEQAVAVLVASIQDKAVPSRLRALQTLPTLGRNARAAVPALTALLSERGWRAPAAFALGKIGPDAKPAVPALVKLLNLVEQQPWVGEAHEARLAAALALAGLGEELDA